MPAGALVERRFRFLPLHRFRLSKLQPRPKLLVLKCEGRRRVTLFWFGVPPSGGIIFLKPPEGGTPNYPKRRRGRRAPKPSGRIKGIQRQVNHHAGDRNV